MTEEIVQEQEKTGYRLILSKLASLPTEYLPLTGRIIVTLIARGQVLVPFLERALADVVPKKAAPLKYSSDIEGEYEIPELPGGTIDLRDLPGMAADEDYEKWGLANQVSEPSLKTAVVIAKADDKMILNRLISPTDPVENYLTQAQVEFLVLLLGNKIGKITRGGVLFFFYVADEDAITYNFFSFKVVGLPIAGRFRFAVRKATDLKNGGVPLKDAYIVSVVSASNGEAL